MKNTSKTAKPTAAAKALAKALKDLEKVREALVAARHAEGASEEEVSILRSSYEDVFRAESRLRSAARAMSRIGIPDLSVTAISAACAMDDREAVRRMLSECRHTSDEAAIDDIFRCWRTGNL